MAKTTQPIRCRYWPALAALPLVLMTGCAAYQLGNDGLFSPDIQTVYVPVFQSDVFRRTLAEWLTEAVVKEIEFRSPYKVVHTPDADSVLYGRVTYENKRILAEDRNDNPRDVEFTMSAQIRWVDRAGNVVLRNATVPIDLSLSSGADFVPEGGQSLTSAEQQVIRETARQIVSQMESGW